jgi:energy-coupling factor transport system ATP-binding protein
MNHKPQNNTQNPASENLVEVRELVHIYPNGNRALDHVSVNICAHEKLAIIGQNGSGKTTLVKHFNGLLLPSNGVVLVRGTDTRKKKTSELARTVGYVFQNPNHQLFCVTVLEELRFGLHNLRLGVNEINRKIEETVVLFQLQAYLDIHPYTLSLGARKLVAIASIYAMGPELMILDEPTTGQDYLSRKILSQAIASIYSSGKSIIFVTHDMCFVAEQADRAVVMSKTKIIFDGVPRDLFVHEDVLIDANLRPPPITQLAQRLTNRGIAPNVLSVPDMVSEIRKYIV